MAATPLPVVVISVSVTIWPAIVADRKGFFKAEGLAVDFINSGASARSLQQVAAGSAPIGSSSMVDTLRAIGGGARVKVFLNSLAVGTHSLVGAKTVKSVPELLGKRVMTGGPGDITTLWWIAMARHYGLDPHNGVALIFSGSTSARLGALLSGGVDATMLSTPQSFKAIEYGYTDLGAVAPFLGEFPMMVWHVNETWALGHEREIAAFARAHDSAVRYLSVAAHKTEVSQMLAKASGSSLEDALKTWDVCMQVNAFVADGAISEEAIARVRDTLVASGDLKVAAPSAAYVDRRFMGLAPR
ncbi:MAG: ABC transporter substrate-binding protein [Xanthobacteraceae bacterium]|nr:ABC transporter substrate-binding protein [Xanthobacteraceae bacterium]